jgi:hypothetical protein
VLGGIGCWMLDVWPATAAQPWLKPGDVARSSAGRTWSRDHRDSTKRWFPAEMEQWLPLIEAKEQEIWKLAAAPR